VSGWHSAAAAAAIGAAAILVAIAWRNHQRVPPPPAAGAAEVAALLDRGDRLRAAGRPYRAVEQYLRAQSAQPDDPEIWRRLGAAALAAQQPGHAQLAADRLLALDADDAAAAAMRAAALALPTPSGEHAGRPRALTRRRCAAARRLADRGRFDDAAFVLAAAAWLDERAAMPERYLANVAYLQGHIADAVTHQRAAVALAPESTLLRRNLAALEAALTPTPGKVPSPAARGPG
jgi:tetratricopeptide (TPR) repeat protein